MTINRTLALRLESYLNRLYPSLSHNASEDIPTIMSRLNIPRYDATEVYRRIHLKDKGTAAYCALVGRYGHIIHKTANDAELLTKDGFVNLLKMWRSETMYVTRYGNGRKIFLHASNAV